MYLSHLLFHKQFTLLNFQGKVKLPPPDVKWQDIKEKVTDMAKHYVKSQRHTIQVNYVDFMNELAILNGNCPNLGDHSFPFFIII